MIYQNLEEALQAAENPVDMLRNAQLGAFEFPVVPAEYSNWRDEQRAWREACVLLDLSHHMTDLYVEGPDALKLFSDLGVNKFGNFEVDKAKQFIACSPSGHVIGDDVLYYLDENSFVLVGPPAAIHWVQYNFEIGGYDASVEREENSMFRQGPPTVFRYQIQGPNAVQVMEKVTGGPLPEVRFFNIGRLTINGREVRALRHGMAGQAGYELSGPWEYAGEVKEAIVEAGQEYGLRQGGSKAYSTASLESGWFPLPLPAIYEGEEMKEFRQWLPARGFATGSLGGSFYSRDITDYYLTPYELGYGRFIDFDHDFVGKEALQRAAGVGEGRHRTKVTLVWDGEDVAGIFGSFLRDGPTAKYIDLPHSLYAFYQYDQVLKDGEMVGISANNAYNYNERAMISLAVVDAEHSEPGTEVTLLWGEEPPSAKPTVESHVQTEIRATVAPAPLAEYARTSYRGAPSLRER